MPYKDKAVRNARARERRAGDPEHAAKVREYMRTYSKEWRLGRLERQRAYDNEWHKAARRKKRGDKFGKRRRKKTDAQIRATLRARKKRWHSKHKGEWNRQRRQQRVANPEHFAALERARYLRNPEARILAQHKVRAKRFGNLSYCSPDEWIALLKQHDFKCFYCHVLLTARTRTVDHKIPLARGGTNDIGNLAPACRSCNCRKHTMTDGEFIRQYPLGLASASIKAPLRGESFQI
jgi:5-methylcytosine-specific restriction endonuclease McrA